MSLTRLREHKPVFPPGNTLFTLRDMLVVAPTASETVKKKQLPRTTRCPLFSLIAARRLQVFESVAQRLHTHWIGDTEVTCFPVSGWDATAARPVSRLFPSNEINRQFLIPDWCFSCLPGSFPMLYKYIYMKVV